MDERMSNMKTDGSCKAMPLNTGAFVFEGGEQCDLTQFQARILLDAGLIYDSGEHYYRITDGHDYADVERCLKGKYSWDMGIGATGYMEPVISLCTDSKQIGLFNGNCGDCVRDFVSYTDETEALIEAHAWFKERSLHPPQVVRPMITKMTMTTSRRRKKK